MFAWTCQKGGEKKSFNFTAEEKKPFHSVSYSVAAVFGTWTEGSWFPEQLQTSVINFEQRASLIKLEMKDFICKLFAGAYTKTLFIKIQFRKISVSSKSAWICLNVTIWKLINMGLDWWAPNHILSLLQIYL